MDLQIRTQTLIDILKLIQICGRGSVTIVFINDEYSIIGNINQYQLDLVERSSIDWEYKKGNDNAV